MRVDLFETRFQRTSYQFIAGGKLKDGSSLQAFGYTEARARENWIKAAGDRAERGPYVTLGNFGELSYGWPADDRRFGKMGAREAMLLWRHARKALSTAGKEERGYWREEIGKLERVMETARAW